MKLIYILSIFSLISCSGTTDEHQFDFTCDEVGFQELEYYCIDEMIVLCLKNEVLLSEDCAENCPAVPGCVKDSWKPRCYCTQ